MFALGEVVGTGRSADVFAHGEGSVLRRYREPRDTELEVAAMEHARSHGFPVPAARAISPTDIVMDRINGRTMLDDLLRRPWLIASHASRLAGLHDQLHAIHAPAWLPAPVGEGDSRLHLDLHPDNVILTAAGPVVIDWPNAGRGPGAVDVAHTWLVLAYSLPSVGFARRAVSLAGRRVFLALFLRHFERSAVAARLGSAGALRLGHRNLPPGELAAIRRLLERSDIRENTLGR
jgi:tRNA A-37 threonylcarbamoyl transferase component Bud32